MRDNAHHHNEMQRRTALIWIAAMHVTMMECSNAHYYSKAMHITAMDCSYASSSHDSRLSPPRGCGTCSRPTPLVCVRARFCGEGESRGEGGRGREGMREGGREREREERESGGGLG